MRYLITMGETGRSAVRVHLNGIGELRFVRHAPPLPLTASAPRRKAERVDALAALHETLADRGVALVRGIRRITGEAWSPGDDAAAAHWPALVTLAETLLPTAGKTLDLDPQAAAELASCDPLIVAADTASSDTSGDASDDAVAATDTDSTDGDTP